MQVTSKRAVISSGSCRFLAVLPSLQLVGDSNHRFGNPSKAWKPRVFDQTQNICSPCSRTHCGLSNNVVVQLLFLSEFFSDGPESHSFCFCHRGHSTGVDGGTEYQHFKTRQRTNKRHELRFGRSLKREKIVFVVTVLILCSILIFFLGI